MAITVPTPADQGAQSLGGVEGQAAQTPYQNLQLPDLAFNARTLGQLGGVVGDFAKEMQRRHEETALLEMQQAYSEFERDLMYNLETGVMKTEKAGAAGITDRVRAESTAFFEQYTQDNKTYTRSATMALKSFAQQRQIGLLDAAARHEMSENERYRSEMKAAASANAIATAGLSFASNTALVDQEAIIRSSTASQFEADRRVAPEVVAELTASRVDEMYRTAISGALMLDTKAGRARAAELYTAAVDAGKLNLSDNDPITRAVVYGTEADGRSAAVSMLVAQAGGDLGKAVEMVADMPNASAEDRGKMVEEIETMMRSKDRAAAATQKDLEARAFALAAQRQLDSMSMLELAQIPQDTLDRLVTLNSGAVLNSDRPLTTKLSLLSMQEWATVDLTGYIDRLTPADMTRFQIMQGEAAQKLEAIRANGQVPEAAKSFIPMLLGSLNITNDAARDTFTLAMTDFIQGYTLANDGAEPSQDQMREEADRLVMRVVIAEGMFMNTRETVAALMVRPPALLDAGGQPVDAADVRDFIRELVDLKGEDAILTPENLQATYLRYLAALQ